MLRGRNDVDIEVDFTFHFGHILILATKTNKIPFIIFTFHFGHILMICLLHST